MRTRTKMKEKYKWIEKKEIIKEKMKQWTWEYNVKEWMNKENMDVGKTVRKKEGKWHDETRNWEQNAKKKKKENVNYILNVFISGKEIKIRYRNFACA